MSIGIKEPPVSNLEHSTLVDLLLCREATDSSDVAYTFLTDGEGQEENLTYGDLGLRARAVGAALQARGATEQPVLLLSPPGLDYVCGFVGCLYAGAIAIPSYPPRFNRSLSRLQSIIEDSRAKLVLTTTAILNRAKLHFERVPALRTLDWVAVDALDEGLAASWATPKIGGDSLAFLQYTSGSTSAPRGVMVSHRNLLENERRIERAFDQSAESVIVSWLPLYHDMGLIGGVLQPLFLGARCVLMPPASFLQRPLRWLQAISRYRATTSGAPNFAYDLCVRKTTPEQRRGLDLSSWAVAFNGAEPIREQTIARFAEAFEVSGFRPNAMHPCYGLAESTLLASAKAPGESPRVETVDAAGLERGRVVGAAGDRAGDSGRGKRLVGCGESLPGHTIAIVDPEKLSRSAPDEVGEIWISGPSVAQGYWRRPAETMDTFGAFISGTGEGPFLRTGDLGFFKDGELFVTGRRKDLIIIRGANHYPQDIEAVVESSHPALRPGCGAAFSVESGGDERLVIVQEVDAGKGADYDSIIENIRQAVTETFDIGVGGVSLVKAGGVPKTSSGKIQRHACRNAYLAGGLEVVAEKRPDPISPSVSIEPAPGPDAIEPAPAPDAIEGIEDWLTTKVGAMLGVAPHEIDAGHSLARYGADSLFAFELSHFVETNLGVRVLLTDLFPPPSIAQLAALIRAQLGEGSRLAEAAPTEQFSAGATFPPLSHGQRALWFLHQVAPESAAYNIANAVKIKSRVDVQGLRRALQSLVDRHPALRTTFVAVEGEPYQKAHERAEVFFHYEDASGWGDMAFDERLKEEAGRPFDLENGPLMRAFLFFRSDRESVLLLTIHHMAADFWSLAILVRELGLFYKAETSNAALRLEPLGSQYAEFARRQAEALAGPEGQRLWEYWRDQLAGELSPLALPTDKPRPAIQTYKGSAELFRLNPRLAGALKDFCQSNGVTLYMALLAAFQILLHRYSGQDQIIVGSPMAGRSGADLAGLVGYFVNPVALKADFSTGPRVKDFLAQARATVSGAFAHQEYPFPLLVERLRAEWDPSRSPIFQVMFVLQKSHLRHEQWLTAYALGEAGVGTELEDLSLESVALEQKVTQFDLTMTAAESEGALAVSLQYNVDLFERDTIRKLAAHYERLLEEMLLHPDRRVSELEYLTEAERWLVTEGWNQTASPYPSDKTIHELVSEQAENRPHATAVVCGREQLSYLELEEQSNRLARYLIRQGVGAEDPVGVCLERNVQMAPALLGILKAGGAYVPMDPAYPAERLAYMVEDSGLKVIVSQQSLLEKLPLENARQDATSEGPSDKTVGASFQNVRIVSVDGDLREIARESGGRPPNPARADNLAYIIYTSGSTGRPKGVAIEHHNAVALIEWSKGVYADHQLQGVLASTSICFDLSVFEFFVTLSRGGKVILAENALQLDKLPAREQVSLINTVPSAIAELARTGAIPQSVKIVNLAGEALHRRLVDEVYGRSQVEEVWNLYGPSEDTTYSTYTLVDRDDEQEPTIGRPVSNTRTYILDGKGQLAPAGVMGELYLAGEGLARGYFNRPDLTADRFTPNPFGREPGQRLYKTGDLCRYLPDGRIEFLGRIDHQVKIRGFRIELPEIEAALTEHPEIAQAVVLVSQGQAEDKRLTAYVVYRQGSERPAGKQIKQYLRQRLPEYMVPSAVVELERLPLTANGKLDRKSLPEVSEQPAEGEPLRTPVEQVLAGVWASALGRQSVGRSENFFEAGGHSLLATRVISRVREAFGVELGVKSLFETPTVEGLAERIEAELKGGLEPPRKILRRERAPGRRRERASFGQERLYFLEQMQAGGKVFHMSGAVRLRGPLNLDALERGFREIARRHEALRTNFEVVDGQVLQVIGEGEGFKFELTDLEPMEAGRRRERAEEILGGEAARPFDLEKESPLRVAVVRLGAEEHVLQITLHHIAGDGWSMGVLAKELGHLYERYAGGEESGLEELEVQYSDYAEWERERQEEEEQARGLEWWKRELSGAEDVELPGDRVRPAAQSYRGRQERFELGEELSGKLRELSGRESATLYMVMMAGLQALIRRYSGQEEYVIGSLVANRERKELEGLIGFFVNAVGIRAEVGGDPKVRELIGRVRERALGAYAHQGIPFEKVVVATGASREMSRSPIYQIVLTMQNAPFEQLQLSGLSVEPIEQAVDAAPVDVTFSISEENNVIKGSVEYAEFIGAGVIRRLVEHYRRALEEMVRDPEQRISRIEFLTQAERRQLLEEWNQTDEAFPLERGYSQLFEEQARKTPDRIAVACGDRRLTYRELNERANRLARILAREGVGPEKVVALLSERRIELLVAILGVFKAGGAYLPLDPHHPPARIRQLVEQSRPALILASDALAADLERTISTFDPEARPRTLGLNPGSDQEVGAENLPPLAGPNNLAYVIYTSGSTGAPKGAMVEQVGMINHLYAKLAELRLGENDVVAQTASQCFDISVWQFLAALLVGGRVQIFDDDLTHDPSALLRQIERESVTVVEVVPSLLRAMLEGATVGEAAVHGLAALRCMMVTGEALPPELASWWLRIYPRVPMLNAYGPTECSDDVTHKVITTPPAEGAPRVPIGKPISNMRMYTLDEVGSPAPIGVAGELHVGGIGVGRGYLDDPSRTAQSFVPDPFSGRPGERLYKTGDSVRYRSDGDLEFLGRIDEQVKIRGFRIELGEIEAALAQHPNVKQAVVIAREDGLGDKRLLAYVVPAEPGGEAQSAGHAVSVPQLQNYLREKLPEYMTPGTFVLLDSLPQTRNGKIDRRALSEVAPAEPEREIAYQPARTHTEEVLSGFWKQSLGGGRFGVREKFFDVGGDSLKLVRVFRLLNERYPDTVTVIDMFKYNTIEALATYIDAKRPVRAEAPALQGFEL